MLKVIDGKIYVNNIETNDTELIGNAFKDFAEMISRHNYKFDSTLLIDFEGFGIVLFKSKTIEPY